MATKKKATPVKKPASRKASTKTKGADLSKLPVLELPKPPPLKIPKQVGAAVDLYYRVRECRRAADKLAAEIKKQETQLANHLIDTIPKSEASGVQGRIARAVINKVSVPQVKDWDALWKYIHKSKAHDLLQRRLSAPAVEAREEDGEKVPGIGKFDVIKVSLTKV